MIEHLHKSECVAENTTAPQTNPDNNVLPNEDAGHSYEEVLNLIGFGRVQKRIMTTCALMILMCMNELMGISVITIAAHCDLQMNNKRKGIVHASALWGKIVSSFFLGHLSDTIGRRPVLIYTTLAANLFSFSSMFMPNYWAFVYFRFFMGVCAGGTLSITLTYLGEFLTPNQRPFLMNYVNISNGVSFVYVPIVAYLVLEMNWTLPITENFIFRPWRLLILFNLLPGFIAAILILQFPESPRLLLALGKTEEAYKAADWVCRQNNDGRSLKDFHICWLNDPSAHSDRKTQLGCRSRIFEIFDDTWELFKGPHVWNFLICSVVLTGSFVISFGLGLWYPVILNDMIFYGDSSLDQTMCDVIIETNHQNETLSECDDHIADTSLFEDLAYGAISIVSYVFLGMLISIGRRKWILMCLLVLGGLCGLALIKITNNTVIVCTFSFFLVFADLSTSTLMVFMLDLIPTHLCAQASCLAITIGRISGSVATYIIGLYLQSHCTEAFLFFAEFALICAVFAHFLSPKLVPKSK